VLFSDENTKKLSSLSEKRLDGLLRIRLEAPCLGQWDANNAILLWWQDRNRRPTRKTAPTCSASITIADSESDEDEEPQLNLEDWNQWLESLT